MSEVIVLYDGYSSLIPNKHDHSENSDTKSDLHKKEQMAANCSCTLIKGFDNVIVDTMTAWDSEKIITGLKKENINPEDISFVISTHGHSDHIGNNNLFLNAKHIVGFSISYKDCYYLHDFDKGEEFVINDSVKVVPTPGHTLSDVSILVSSNGDTVAITGDLFEKFEDIENPDVWLSAGSEDPALQRKNRCEIANISNWIIPGHGPKFRVTNEIREILKLQLNKSEN